MGREHVRQLPDIAGPRIGQEGRLCFCRQHFNTYMNVVRGTDQRFPEWRTPVYRPVTA